MALDWGQNFVSTMYLENKMTDFHQILYTLILKRSRFGLLAYYSPALKLGCLSFPPSVSHNLFEKYCIESNQILYVHLY